MNIKFSFVCSYVLCSVLYLRIYAQSIDEAKVRQVGTSLDQFALNFLAETSDAAPDDLNLAISPYNIWSLLVIISEGAQNNTASELEKTLGIPDINNRDTFRNAYQSLEKHLTRKDNPDVTLDTTNAIYTRAEQNLKTNFLQTARNIYNVDIRSVNFNNTEKAANIINDDVDKATRGRIKDFVKPSDLADAQVFTASTLYFKGSWAMKFNKSLTTSEDFYDEQGTSIGKVDMMSNTDAYPFTLLFDNKATAVELPYIGNKMAMIALLPRRNVPLKWLLEKLAATPFSDVIGALDKAVEQFGEEPTVVQIPKFKIISDLNLNEVLDKMGIKDVFNSDKANLLGMFYNYLYISRILQRAEIEVDEEGTVASSASGAAYQFKISPPKFIANKPFAYIIYDKETRGIVFAGKFVNPKNQK